MKAAFNFKPFLHDAALVSRVVQDAIGRVRVEAPRAKSLASLDEAVLTLLNTAMPVQFLRLVAEDGAVRAAASEAYEAINKAELAVFAERDVYEALRVQRQAASNAGEVAALDRYLRDFEVKGACHLAGTAQRAAVHELSNRIATLECQGQKNIADDASTVAFTVDELDGVDQSFLDSLQSTSDGRKIVTLQYPHVLAVMRLAKSRDTRRRLWECNSTKAAATNATLIPQLIALRLEKARLVGNRSDAELRLGRGQRILSSPEDVDALLDSVSAQLSAKLDAELTAMRSLHEVGEQVLPWDVAFLHYKVQQRDYAIDQQRIKEVSSCREACPR